jgi:hypothetical protein
MIPMMLPPVSSFPFLHQVAKADEDESEEQQGDGFRKRPRNYLGYGYDAGCRTHEKHHE